jgi:oligopeptide/dipeptide ABC transporter ATP-binding protein
MAPLLEIKGLKTHFSTDDGILQAVDGVDITINKGETLCVVGESGCGKTVTAMSILKLIAMPPGRIAAGEIIFEGRDLVPLTSNQLDEIRAKEIGFIFQEPMTSLNPVLTVGEQIAESLRRHENVTRKQALERTIEMLKLVQIPNAEGRVHNYPHQFSGGMRQRVMIAMALACKPKLIIADEPTTALDVTIQAQILDLLAKLQAERGMALLLISHDLGVVAKVAQRVAVMYAGEIVEVATREAFFRAPQHPYSQKLFAALPGAGQRGELAVIRGQVPPLTQAFNHCRFAERCDLAFDRCRGEAPKLIEPIKGQLVRCHLREKDVAAPRQASSSQKASVSARQESPRLLEAKDVKVHFPIRRGIFRRTVGYVKAVDGVSLELRAGRTLAIVGESGSGKTTLGKGVLQLIAPTAGAVVFQEKIISGKSRAELRPLRGAMQIIFQDPYASLNPRLRVSEILLEGMRSLGVLVNDHDRLAKLKELLGEVGLPAEALDRYPHEFSGGQRQRIAIARALAVNPKLIVCDEPTSALDVSVQAQILNLLRSLQERFGIAYLFITHNIAVVDYLAHEVAVMYKGKIVERGTVDAVLRNPQHEYTRTLLAAVPTVD